MESNKKKKDDAIVERVKLDQLSKELGIDTDDDAPVVPSMNKPSL
jgi:hypothetical protein